MDAVDPRIYSEAQDPVDQAAWVRARELAKTDPVAALPALRDVVERCPNLVRAHLAYQDAALALAGTAEAEMLAYYHDLAQGDTPVIDYVRARLFETSYDRGTHLEKILARDRSFGWAHLSLGRIRRGQGQLLNAAEAFAAALVFDPSLHEAHLERGDALAELGRLQEAAVDYDAYFEAVPDDWPAMREYVALLIYRLNRIDRALELLARLDVAAPGDLELRMHRGAAMWRAFRPREALVHYLAVIEVDPGCSRALLDIGLIYYDAMSKDWTDDERRLWWPKARAAFKMFMALGNPHDGHESFERTLAVPYRLGVIAELLGPDDGQPAVAADLR
ncbi:MAG: tetratricopeptide repeat protein [Planctomycetes bacterium]|nr:tetratricopeptide repeat protein [Planctomycetota bacterium]